MPWITPEGFYYIGDRASSVDVPVPQRPAPHYIWQDGEWVAGPLPVPISISTSQFWQQIEADGLTSAATALIDAIPDRVMQIRATRVTEYVRSDAQLIQLATLLGKDSDDIDEFFRQAGAR
jgi:hypothetical protein